MNLDTCTSGQRTIITTLDRPLMVSAGAGSGKTFTLTQRIAYALELRGDNAPFVESIDEVLAITFTKKAAAELKSRIKHRLTDMGLTDEALKVDDAWISTIHGMCSRILREHALEIGIDPAFEVISETDSARYRAEAFDKVIKEYEESDDKTMIAFLRALSIQSTPARRASIEDYIGAILARVEALPQGFDALEIAETSQPPHALLKTMIEQGEEFFALLESLPKLTKTDERYRSEMAVALAEAQEYITTHASVSFDDESFDRDAFAKVIFAFPKTSRRYRPRQIETDFFESYRETYADVATEVSAGCAAQDLKLLIMLARDVNNAYQASKGKQCLDNTDLLRKTYEALRSYPLIAQQYQNRFSLIMVDEFQDTDELQVALIDLLAQPGRQNVCTVGDAQQSIYRFRGADVNVFYAYREELAQTNPCSCFVNLPDNFRSHADILSFVDTVFSQKEVFGSHFLSLNPRGTINAYHDPLFVDRPRISMALFDCRRGRASMSDGRRECADHIARHFAALRADGASPDQMVILLGAMSNADVYAQALRDAGFECLIAGGSTFAQASEVTLVTMLLRVLVNRFDDEALYHVLVSPLFALNDAALLHLATRTDQEGKVFRRSCAAGFDAWPDEKGLVALAEEEAHRIDFAYRCLAAAERMCQQAGLTAAVRYLLQASGWFIRLERQGAQGQAIVGNVYKALDMIAEIEREGFGVSRSVERFINDCQTLKLAPGVLSTASSNFVRIMTIHASKGLEFPHVAVAEMRLSHPSQSLFAENIGTRTYLALHPRFPKDQADIAAAVRSYASDEEEGTSDVLQAATRGARLRFLETYTYNQEQQEARRLLYVALTRASASLMIGVVYQGNKDFSYEGKGILNDLYRALSWECSEQAPEQRINYGGSLPLHLTLQVLDAQSQESVGPVTREEEFSIPPALVPVLPFSQAYCPSHDEVFSYSSLPHDDASPGSEMEYDAQYVARAAGELDHSGMGTFNDQSNQHIYLDAFDVASHELMKAEGPMQANEAPSEEDATALGNAFHRLAQNAIDDYRHQRDNDENRHDDEDISDTHKQNAAVDHGEQECDVRYITASSRVFDIPCRDAFHRQAQLQGLSSWQEQRLVTAFHRWCTSECARDFVSHGLPYAEVPFMVALGPTDNPVFLEGEIDGLVVDENKVAYLIDYKTGGTAEETPHEIYRKHLLQAQCYAYALLSQGLHRVEASFVRVEQEDPCNPFQPQVQRYTFSQGDKDTLENVILAQYKRLQKMRLS